MKILKKAIENTLCVWYIMYRNITQNITEVEREIDMKSNNRKYKGYIIYKTLNYGCTYYKISGKEKSFCTLRECKQYIDSL